jgi:hypothetical protein
MNYLPLMDWRRRVRVEPTRHFVERWSVPNPKLRRARTSTFLRLACDFFAISGGIVQPVQNPTSNGVHLNQTQKKYTNKRPNRILEVYHSPYDLRSRRLSLDDPIQFDFPRNLFHDLRYLPPFRARLGGVSKTRRANFPKTTIPMTDPTSDKTRGHRKALQPNVFKIPKNSPAKVQIKT